MRHLKLFLTNPRQFVQKVIVKLGLSDTFVRRSINFDKFRKYVYLIYSGENEMGLSHLDMWIPYFPMKGDKTIILVRSIDLYEKLCEKYPEYTVIFAGRKEDVDYFIKTLPYLRACFYPSNTGLNIHLLRHNHLKHIFIGHGDSDKTASAHKFFRVYDENWVAGEAHIDRFKNEGFDCRGLRHVIVGRPRLEKALTQAEVPWRERFEGKMRLLYLPTWEGFFKEQNYTSVPLILPFLREERTREIFHEISVKMHPWLGRKDSSLHHCEAQYRKSEGVLIYDKSFPVQELIERSNVFICDISAVVSESLAVNAPIFVYIPKEKEVRLAQSRMSYTDYTYTFSTPEELSRKIETVIVKGDDYLAAERLQAMEYILGREATLERRFIRELSRVENG